MRPHSNYFKVMHWISALGILSCMFLAIYFSDLKFSPEKMKLINYHKWLGVLTLLLLVPRSISSISGYSKITALTISDKIAKLVHIALYALMALTPLVGWAMSDAKGFNIVLFGKLPLPVLLAPNKDLAKILTQAHEILAYSMLSLVLLHIAGAVFRQTFKNEKIITEMLPFNRSKENHE